MTRTILELTVEHEPDVVLARQRARQIAAGLGFDALEQTRVSTAASEVARDALARGGGRIEFRAIDEPSPSLHIEVTIPGFKESDLATATSGASPMGLVAARRLMDRLRCEPRPEGGAAIVLEHDLPRKQRPATDAEILHLIEELSNQTPRGPFEEVRQQNQELLRAMEELRRRQAETAELNRELEETNRGVLALYHELDEKATSLRRVSDLKSRFLSNMSHEFRSPLNSILSLCRFLLERQDGELNEEQERQVQFIRKAAEGLTALVNDLLDMAKVEAGKVVVRAEPFEVADLFVTLRGMIRPLMTRDAVSLVFDSPHGSEMMVTDEAKVGQILRNFLSNAVKFTERGEIRVAAESGPGEAITFRVSDTGIGIAEADLGRVFDEFAQIDNPLQSGAQGTGLGLPLARKLAEILGGGVSVRSESGVGSTFSAVIPIRYREGIEPGTPEDAIRIDPARQPILVVDEDPTSIYVCERHLEGSIYQVIPARSALEARRLLNEFRPAAVILDILVDAESGWTFLSELKGRSETRTIPVLVLTVVAGEARALDLGADAFTLKPVDRPRLLVLLRDLSRKRLETILVIDDDESHRYLLVGLLRELGHQVIEAANGQDGLAQAVGSRPQAIFLDLIMPDMTGFEVLDRLRTDPATAEIPVIIETHRDLSVEEFRRLRSRTSDILAKMDQTRAEALTRLREALERAGVAQPTDQGVRDE